MTAPATRTAKPGPRWKWLLSLGVAIALIAAVIVAFKYFKGQELLERALDWVGQLGPWGPIIFIAIYISAAVLFIPASVLTLGAGAVFGVAWGSVYVSIASTLGATSAFLVGRYLARARIARKIEGNERFVALDKAVAKQGWKIVGLARLSPVLPFSLLSYAFSLTKVKLREYVFASWIGMMPGTLMYVYIGSLAQAATGERNRSSGEWVLYGIGLLATVVVTVFVTRLAKKALAQKTKEQTPSRSFMSEQSEPTVLPWDTYNQTLVANVHPAQWKNPTPAAGYNLVVIGGGTAGLVCAVGAAGLGAKVALIEKHLLGGDCLNVGCVPSKAILAAAHTAAIVRGAGALGVEVPSGTRVNFARVMERMRKLRSDISPHDSAKRLNELGIDVFLGQGRFLDSATVAVGDATLSFARAVICTGARAAAPPIDGLDTVPYLTNETLFSLTELPKRIGIIGAGPIGCEMAQAFARFGSEVHLVESTSSILLKEDRDAADLIRKQLVHDGVNILAGAKDLKLARSDGQGAHMSVKSDGKRYDLTVDQLLVAVGRAPNVEGLDLENAGVEHSKKGVTIDDRFRTTNKRIFAAGDICSPYQFTHAADFMARAVIRNAFFFGRSKHSALVVPWCTYTSPELAHVGLTAANAEKQGIAIDTFTQPMSGVDRAILEGETGGFVRVHVKKGSDEIVGATIVATHAGDMIGSFSIAMTQGIGLGSIANCMHPYPTQGEAVRKVGDLYSRTRLTPLVKKLMHRWLAWIR